MIGSLSNPRGNLPPSFSTTQGKESRHLPTPLCCRRCKTAIKRRRECAFWARPRSHPAPEYRPFSASRIRFAKLRLSLTPLRDFSPVYCSRTVPGKHSPPFSRGFRPPFTSYDGAFMELFYHAGGSSSNSSRPTRRCPAKSRLPTPAHRMVAQSSQTVVSSLSLR